MHMCDVILFFTYLKDIFVGMCKILRYNMRLSYGLDNFYKKIGVNDSVLI